MADLDPASLSDYGTIPGIIVALGAGASLILSAMRKRHKDNPDAGDEAEQDEQEQGGHERRILSLLGRLYQMTIGYGARTKEPFTEDERDLLHQVRDTLH